MSRRQVLAGLAAIAAVVEGLAAGVVPMNLLPLLLVLLGLVFAPMEIDVGDTPATRFLVVAIAAGAADQADVLGHIPAIGAHLDSILSQYTNMLYGGAVGIVVMRLVNGLKG